MADMPKPSGELIQFKIVEKEYEVKVPKFVEVPVEVPKYEQVVYEKPVIKEVQYERPVVKINDMTKELKDLIESEIRRVMSEVIATLKLSFELPMPRIVQVTPRKREGS